MSAFETVGVDPQPSTGHFAAAIAALITVVAAPVVVIGVCIGEHLRRRGLSWSWPSLAIVPGALPVLLLYLVGPGQDLAGMSQAVLRRDVVGVLAFAAWWWVALIPVATTGWMLWRENRDRLLGGESEDLRRLRIGPITVLRQRRAAAVAAHYGAYSPGGYWFGRDQRGDVVHMPALRTHATVVGGSGTGKTNTAEVVLEGHVAGGGGLVVLDGKGGRDLPRAVARLGARYNRPVLLWSVNAYNDPVLDALRAPWNPLGFGNPTELKDRIASSEEQSEPYYAEIAERGLLMACSALSISEGVVELGHVASLMSNPAEMIATLEEVNPSKFEDDIVWLRALEDGEKSGLRGIGLRLRTMVASHGGEWLGAPPPRAKQIDLYRAIRNGWLVVFTLPEGTYPKLIPKVARYALSALNAVCTKIEGEGDRVNTIAFLDEMSAFQGDQLAATFERGRSAGVHVLVATQSLSNFESAGGTKLLDAALDNSETLIVHRQMVPEAAEKLALVGGTEERWEQTHQVGRRGSAIHRELGLDETGSANRRLVQHFRAHPNTIKNLGVGQAVVITTRPNMEVRVVDVRAGITARQ
jgi:conjugal transfer pilus assembly protein TraD